MVWGRNRRWEFTDDPPPPYYYPPMAEKPMSVGDMLDYVQTTRSDLDKLEDYIKKSNDKKKEKDKEKEHTNDLITAKEMWLYLIVFSLPVGWGMSTLIDLCVTGIQKNMQHLLSIPH